MSSLWKVEMEKVRIGMTASTFFYLDPWLDLGATSVAARRDLVAAAVALRRTDSAAYDPPPT